MTSSKLESILQRASRYVTPSRVEEAKLARIASLVRTLLEEKFGEEKKRNNGIVVPELCLGGSYAKGTWLKGSADVDYFLLYPITYTREHLEGEAIKISSDAVRKYKINLRFAEHPYVEVFIEDVRINIVPCYKVDRGNWQSAADRSPFHAEYIKSRFDEKLRNETRLLKKFVKNSGVYGAEVKVQGFSGYVCEVLVLKYGSFGDVLTNLSDSKPSQVISFEDGYDKDFTSSFKSALVILDPVDITRNLGSAISTENVAKLVLRSREFLENPSVAHFKKEAKQEINPKYTKAVLRTKKDLLSRILTVSFKTEKRSVDILWGQLKKSSASLASKLESVGFSVIRQSASSNEEDESAFVFLFSEHRISELRIREGPEYFRAEEVRKYSKKNSEKSLLTWINEEGRVLSLARRDRDLSDARKALNSMLSRPANLNKLGLSHAIREEISKGFKLDSGESLLLQENRNLGKRMWLAETVLCLVNSDDAVVH
jgi:tRNA nucleotidyltransferase (CCA-adding enzyme)